jgi:hypothetical protein
VRFMWVCRWNWGACGCPERGKRGDTRPKACIKRKHIFTLRSSCDATSTIATTATTLPPSRLPRRQERRVTMATGPWPGYRSRSYINLLADPAAWSRRRVHQVHSVLLSQIHHRVWRVSGGMVLAGPRICRGWTTCWDLSAGTMHSALTNTTSKSEASKLLE